MFDEDASNTTKDDLVSLMMQNITLVASHFGNVQSQHPVVLLGERRASGVVPKLTLKLRQVSFNLLILQGQQAVGFLRSICAFHLECKARFTNIFADNSKTIKHVFNFRTHFTQVALKRCQIYVSSARTWS